MWSANQHAWVPRYWSQCCMQDAVARQLSPVSTRVDVTV